MPDSPPNEASPTLQRARGLWAQNHKDDALVLFEQAVAENPRDIRVHVEAARAFGLRFQLDRAEALIAKLCAIDPSQPAVHHFAGDLYDRLKLPGKAMACYERAASLPGALPATWMALARACERSHRLDEAMELIDRALAVRSDLATARLVRARLERRTGQVAAAEASLRSLLESLPEGVELASEAWAELAMMLDRRGDYDGAMSAIEACKRPLRSRSTAPWQASERWLSRFSRLIDTVSAADLQRWREEASARAAVGAGPAADSRTAVLTGFPRSGTTLLEQVLDAHPDLISTEERDVVPELYKSLPHASDPAVEVLDVLRDLSADRIQVERERYFAVMESFLDEPIGGRVHLDKNPAFNMFIPVMLRLFPETRFIVAVRDPRDVVLSCYLRYLPVNPVSVRFLTLKRTAERYAIDMSAWLKLRDVVGVPFCVVRYEDAVDDLAGQARRMLETLGLPWDQCVMEYRERSAARPVISPTYEAVAEPVHRRAVGRWKNYEKYLEPVLETLEPFVREFGYS